MGIHTHTDIIRLRLLLDSMEATASVLDLAAFVEATAGDSGAKRAVVHIRAAVEDASVDWLGILAAVLFPRLARISHDNPYR